MKLSAPLLLCMLSIPTAAFAQADKNVEDFFKGKTIRIVVGAAAGTAYDGYSRLIARHLGRFLPGAPQFVVNNMLGAGGMVATNWLYNVAPKDGTVLGSDPATDTADANPRRGGSSVRNREVQLGRQHGDRNHGVHLQALTAR